MSLTEKYNYLGYSDDAFYDFIDKEGCENRKHVKYVTKVSNKKQLTPVKSYFYLVFHCITSSS